MGSNELIGKIIIDGSLLINENEIKLTNAPLFLLNNLKYSNIPTGICYEKSLSADKAHFLESTAKLYSFKCFMVNVSSVEETVDDITMAWNGNGGRFLYVTSNCNEGLSVKLSHRSWQIMMLRDGSELTDGTRSDSISSTILYVDKLEEVPFAICQLNRKAKVDDCVTVGYIMKPSREEDFAKRSAFPWRPTKNGLMFMPITFELPISVQLQEIDILLHKATDEIVSIEKSSSAEFFDKITYTKGMQELKMNVENQRDICIIDSFSDIFPVVDRLKTQQILLGLNDLDLEGHPNIRGPHFLKVDNFDEPDLAPKLLKTNLTLPAIVKPQVACGVPDAHSMAIIFSHQDCNGLNVPLPAVVQEYVNHSSTLFKFYVLGEKVFYAVKKSTPNSDRLQEFYKKNGSKPLLFDSLKSLPTDKAHPCFEKEDNQHIDLELVTEAACWLRRKINLTIFGFDVVIQEDTGDHVIVDVNYLPSFKEVPDAVAIPAFWEAIKSKYELRKGQMTI